MSYDPDARRDTPLALELKAMIRERGPLPVKRYMQLCLMHPEHGYYRRRMAIGANGDFITAPEISQVFGELIGLWAVVVWQQMGAPARFTLTEVGPGRGTMLADALRAAARVPGFLAAADICLIEPNAKLRQVQAAGLERHKASVRYLEPQQELPPAPTIMLANEYLDCLPVGQLERGVDDAGQPVWRERTVCLDAAGELQFSVGRVIALRSAADVAFLRDAKAGSIVEDRDVRGVFQGLLGVAQSSPAAALLIDYGHMESCLGDSVQAVRQHRLEHPLTSPGEADITAHVDFAAFKAAVLEEATRPGMPTIAVDGPVTQAEFLGRLGIVERASRLMAANPARAGEIEAGVVRLLSPQGMGTRFKAIGLRSPSLPPPPGFAG